MPPKTLTLVEDAYKALLAVKRPGESFSDAVRRLTRPRGSLTERATAISPESARAIAEAIAANRRHRADRRRKRLGVS